MSGAGGSPRERRRAEVSGAAVQSRGGRDSGRAAGPGPGRAVLFTFRRAGREPGPAVPLPGAGGGAGRSTPVTFRACSGPGAGRGAGG